MSKRPRPRRVAVRGARMHFANTSADVLNVSRSGALIRLNYQPRLGGEWPLVLELPAVDEPLWLNGRVVRCRASDPQSRHMPLASREYLLALKFIDLSPGAQAVLDQVCGTIPSVKTIVVPAAPRRDRRRSFLWRLRRLSLSRRRRCPECRSADVTKEMSRRYRCKQCGREFSGLRLGPVRVAFICAFAIVMCAPDLTAQRMRDGHPDLQGFWTNGTATPLQRPPEFAGKEFFTPEEAAEYERTALNRLIQSIPEVDRMAADLNYIYLDRKAVVDGRRTSLIVDPPDGRIPGFLPEAQTRAASRRPPSSDDPEGRALDERCLLSVVFGSSNSSPPLVPNPFAQNFYQIVQTRQYVMIYSELVHDARMIRMNAQHVPSTIRHWLGDSVGHWEGDTLVVDTTNFNAKTRFRGSTEQLHVVERFTRKDANTILYRFTVEDPETWSRPWTAEIPFKATSDRIFEYACHEGNYSLGNALRGARFEEQAR